MIVIQIFTAFHNVRISSCKEQSIIDVLDSMRTILSIQSNHQTDLARPTEMSAELGLLKYPPFPEQYQEWPGWIRTVLVNSQDTVFRVKNAQQQSEECKFFSWLPWVPVEITTLL